MKKKAVSPGLFQVVIDSCSLINIQRKFGITALEKVKDEILIPEQVKIEVADHPKINKKDPLRKFVLDHPEIVVTLRDEEEERFFELLAEPGIDSGEAAAMAVALLRGRTLVIDERETKATGRARELGIKTISFEKFINKMSKK